MVPCRVFDLLLDALNSALDIVWVDCFILTARANFIHEDFHGVRLFSDDHLDRLKWLIVKDLVGDGGEKNGADYNDNTKESHLNTPVWIVCVNEAFEVTISDCWNRRRYDVHGFKVDRQLVI